MSRRAFWAALLLAGCQAEPTGPTGPTPAELYSMACVDSVVVVGWPYDCANPPDGAVLVVVIDNPTR